jgi:response regulator of citrate/malate metabolism
MRPDAVLLDVYLRDGHGVAVAECLTATGSCRVVLTSSRKFLRFEARSPVVTGIGLLFGGLM